MTIRKLESRSYSNLQLEGQWISSGGLELYRKLLLLIFARKLAYLCMRLLYCIICSDFNILEDDKFISVFENFILYRSFMEFFRFVIKTLNNFASFIDGITNYICKSKLIIFVWYWIVSKVKSNIIQKYIYHFVNSFNNFNKFKRVNCNNLFHQKLSKN